MRLATAIAAVMVLAASTHAQTKSAAEFNLSLAQSTASNPGYNYGISNFWSSVQLTPNAPSYSCRFDGWLDVALNVDAVAVRRMAPKSVTGLAGREVLDPKSIPAEGSISDYKPVFEEEGLVQGEDKSQGKERHKGGWCALSQINLTANPYTVKSLKGATIVVLAKARETKEFPNIVAEQFATLVKDKLDVRVTNLSMSADRKLLISIEYRRKDTGPSNPFLDSVYAVDVTGKDIGGGRWSVGNPFQKTGTLNFQFVLAENQTHKTFRMVAVTESQLEPVELDISEVFQK